MQYHNTAATSSFVVVRQLSMCIMIYLFYVIFISFNIPEVLVFLFLLTGQPSSIGGAGGAGGTSATGTDSMTISFKIQGPAGTRISLIGNHGPTGTTGAKQGSNIISPEKGGSSAVTKVIGKTKTDAASGKSYSADVSQSAHSAASVSSKTSSVNV